MRLSYDTIRRKIAAPVLLLALAACGGDEETVEGPSAEGAAGTVAVAPPEPALVPPTGCPAVRVLEALHQRTVYGPAGPGSGDVVAQGVLGLPDGGCEYDFEGASVEVSLTLPMQVQAGPSWRPGQSVDLPYNVWVVDTRRTPPNDIVLRERFPAPFELEPDETFSLYQEELVLTIPLPDGPITGQQFSVLIGFDRE